ncbi:MAG: OsmC family protein [Lentimicrobiaceae bacterium]|nr:OsmC family protein [Lentimicrobiaceae bacterium]
MKHKVNTRWNENMQFDTVVNGHHLIMDANAEVGGMDAGPRPKELLLAGLAGCTGMDVISILKKMRMEPAYFNIRIEADMTDEHPKHYQSMHIIYEFAGDNLDMDKINKAVSLSQERYCGVSHMYSKMMTLTHEIAILDKKSTGLDTVQMSQ